MDTQDSLSEGYPAPINGELQRIAEEDRRRVELQRRYGAGPTGAGPEPVLDDIIDLDELGETVAEGGTGDGLFIDPPEVRRELQKLVSAGIDITRLPEEQGHDSECHPDIKHPGYWICTVEGHPQGLKYRTLGHIADELRIMRAQGVTLESLKYAVDRVFVPEPEPRPTPKQYPCCSGTPAYGHSIMCTQRG